MDTPRAPYDTVDTKKSIETIGRDTSVESPNWDLEAGSISGEHVGYFWCI